MISMRYARNLADGLGLVWNPRDEFEGYTNLGWVLVMAAVHAVGVPERLTSLVVEVINIGLAVVVLALTDRLLRCLVQPPPWLRLIAVTTLGLSIDLVYWVVNGFETPLLTTVFLWALVGRSTTPTEASSRHGPACCQVCFRSSAATPLT